MSTENAKKFLQFVNTDEKAAELLAERDAAQTEEEGLAVYVKAAEALGFAVTAEEIREAVAEAGKVIAKQSEDADKAILEISGEDLDSVAGGTVNPPSKHSECWYSFKDYENCSLCDACDRTFCDYDNYLCKHNKRA